ncbi:MAG TPA: protein kinase [Gemmataceae bacterium]|nr:protein kinase [Gemmataceae bacterium]
MLVGTQVANYKILERLGEGGRGVVYKAVDIHLDRIVAIKALNTELTGNPELEQRFRAEAKAQANLNHTNLATLYTLLIEGGLPLMVMEYIEGETFEQMVQRRGPIPAQETIPIFRQALLGIGYAHRMGIIHRDIKPSNIMLNKQGVVKVMDFGIAKVLGARGMTRTGTQMGTAFYMSPEQVLNRGLDIRSDIYSLGVTLYEMLTANVPFGGDSDYVVMTSHVNAPPPLPTKFYPYIPQGLQNAALKALEKNPDARFQTVEEFGTALEQPDTFGVSPIQATPTPATATLVERAPQAAAATAAGDAAVIGRNEAATTVGAVATKDATLAVTNTVGKTTSPEHRAPQRRTTPLLIGGGAVLAVLAAGGAWYFLGSARSAKPPGLNAPPIAQGQTGAPNPAPISSDPEPVSPVQAVRPGDRPAAKAPAKNPPSPPRPAQPKSAPVVPVRPDPAKLLQDGKDQLANHNAQAARESFRKASDAGNVQATVLLGTLYAQGSGGPKSDFDAVRMFRQAAALGNARGMYNLGLMYEAGRVAPTGPDNQTAANWYAQAVNHGDRDAAFRLGLMREQGRGVPKDLKEARRLYTQAGTPEARTRLASLPPQ